MPGTGEKIVTFYGERIALYTKFCRITQNPQNLPDSYPKTGDIVTLKNHWMLPDGKYLVTMVTEFEPAYRPIADTGRDIRFSVRTPARLSQPEWCGTRFLMAVQEKKELL